MPAATPLLSAAGLKVYFPVGRSFFGPRTFLKAVDGVDITIRRGETLAVVGESGCGKSTLGRALIRLGPVSAGTLRWEESLDVRAMTAEALRAFRRQVQMIFQDPAASLNPRHSAGTLLAEPLRIHHLAEGAALKDEVISLLESVGLEAADARKFPHQFSGGQRQRLAIARALAVKPQLVVADEPVSALDMSVQAQVLGLLEDLKKRFGLTYLFISHDLGAVQRLADRVAVMYLGHIVEEGETEALFRDPRHPYTAALLAAADAQRREPPLAGEIPSPAHPPPGCPFQTRCPKAEGICREDYPPWVDTGENRVACWIYAGFSNSRKAS